MSAIQPQPLDLPMRRFVWRRRRLRAAGAACVGGALVLAWLIGGGLLDRYLRLSSFSRVAMLCALLLILAGSLMRVVMLLIDRRFNRQIAAGQIEAMDHYLGERLLTVITQAELPLTQRGSAQLVAYIERDVVDRLRIAPPDRRLTWRFVRPAIILLGLVAAAMIALSLVPSLDLTRLIARQLFPLADLPPVTTTRIDVITGSLDLPQGQPLAVVADISNSDGPVTLLIGADDKQLQPIAASRVFGGRYSATVRAIETDQIYRVQAGDATSAAYHVRVMRRPGVVRLATTLTFPDYLHRGPLTVNASDGKIDAVRGTRVHAMAIATESLRQATAALPQGTLPGDSTIDPAVRTFNFTVDQSGPWSINLVSDRGVSGNGPGGMTINAVDDKPPIARLLKSDLRLAPTDVAAIPFEASDDFGLQTLRLDVASGDKTLKSIPLDLPNERRMVRDVATIDLAPFAMTFGDVVTLTLTAIDGAKQTTVSAPCQLLMSPRSVDPRAMRRIEALTAARELAESAVNEPADAAADTRAILRAMATTDTPAANNFLERQLDVAQQAASAMVWNAQMQWTQQQQDGLRDVAAKLKTLERSEQAKGVLADQENIAAAEKPSATQSPAERAAVKQSIQRAKRDIAERIQALQLAPDAGDTPARLAQIAAEGDAAVNAAQPPSQAQTAAEWAGTKGPAADANRDRITVAAQAQVLRGDADLAWARDLQLVARTMTAVGQGDDESARGKVKDATAALETLHAATLKSAPPPGDVVKKADDARRTLAKLTNGSSQPAATRPSLLEDAMATPAEIAEEHDDLLKDEPTPKGDPSPEKWQPPADANGKPDHSSHPNDSPAERQARSLNRAAKQQNRIAARTEHAAAEAAQKLAEQQQNVADELKKIEGERDEDFFQQPAMDREQSLAALRQMQQELADLPQQMLSARKTAESAAQQKAAADRAMQQSQQAGGDGKAAADRSAADAKQQANSAMKQAQQRADALGSSAGAAMAGGTPKLGAMGTPVAAAAQKLAADMQSLKADLAKAELPAADAGQAKALESIAALQATLRTAQRQVIDRDPVVAARFFAQQAAAAMHRDPPDLVAARSDQKAASASLERAWDQAMARSVHDRLGKLPSFRGLLDDDLFAATGDGPAISSMERSALPQWGRLRSQKTADVLAGDAEFQPAGYEHSLSAYFEALGRARSSKAGK